MRKLFLLLLLVCSIDLASQTLNKHTEEALEYIGQGYLSYGFEKLKSAAATNDVAAQFYIALCYSNGIVVEKNEVEAFKLYRRTAERGLPDGMYYLSLCYQNGLGVNSDNNRSNEWLQRFKNKGGKFILPDISPIYNEGLKYINNYTQTPNGNTNRNEKVLAQNNEEINNPKILKSISIHSNPKPIQKDSEVKEMADVDVNIPQNTQDNVQTFAVIIGNENYQKVSKVQFAQNDANTFAVYCQKVLGLPQKNVRIYKDATYATILSAIDDIKNIAKVYKRDINVIFYYAGHGIPNESSCDAYLLPVDTDGRNTEVCYPLYRLYSELGGMGAHSVIVFMDACFSGSERGDNMLMAARGVAIKPKAANPYGNMIVFSATSNDETAYPYEEKGHGLFTYFLLKKLRDSKGNVTLGELGNYIIDNVSREAVVSNSKKQTPTVIPSQAVVNSWQSMKLK